MKLNAKMRNAIPARDFALPGPRKFPIMDKSHAKNALARASGKSVQGKVDAAVKRKYPGLGKSKEPREPQSHAEWEKLGN